MRKVRIGILGGGGILGAHAPGYELAGDLCEIVAVAEPDASRHARVRQLLGDAVRIEPDYHSVAAADDVDAVDILLPHDLHMPATIAAAQAGKHVLIEKVMARNVWECDRMIEACEKAGVSLTVCHDRRYHDQWRALKEVVDSGALGDIFYWKLDHNQNVAVPPGHWIRSRDCIGGGAIMSCLTHQIDALRWYGGEVRSVTCMTKVIPERMEGESLGVIAAQMASGALAQLSINWWTSSHAAGNGLWYEMVQACGTVGEAYYMSGRGTFVLVRDDEQRRAFPQYAGGKPNCFVKVERGETPGHVGCVREWLKLLRGEPSQISTSGRDVRGTVEVAEAACMSAESGREVALPIVPRPWEGGAGGCV
jgi:predicted dehydrogenase